MSSDANGNGNTGATTETDVAETLYTKYIKRVWQLRNYLIVEPFYILYSLASSLCYAALNSFPLNKACRANLAYNAGVCNALYEKEAYNIYCDNFTLNENLTISSYNFHDTVCKAEIEANTLAAIMIGIKIPIGGIFILIVLLFAGSWSDRYGKIKPCMILPVIGDMLLFICLLISAIFFETLPMEYAEYTGYVLSMLCGGNTFCLMAIYSYMTVVTPEDDRIFRFGLFSMLLAGATIIAVLINGFIFQLLGYTFSFVMAICLDVIAILYGIFFIQEPVSVEAKSSELPTYQAVETANTNIADNNSVAAFTNNATVAASESIKPPSPTTSICKRFNVFLHEFFDPTLALDCFKLPLRQRANYDRMLLLLLFVNYLLIVGPAAGENGYFYAYTTKKLSWNLNSFTFFTISILIFNLIGTFIGSTIFSKFLGIPHIYIGIFAVITVLISRVVLAFANTLTLFYVGAAIDMFAELRQLAIRIVASIIVQTSELNKLYATLGIIESLGQFIFSPIYSIVYQNTLQTFPGAYYLMSEIFYIPNLITFILCAILMRRFKSKTTEALKLEESAGTVVNDDFEITHL